MKIGALAFITSETVDAPTFARKAAITGELGAATGQLGQKLDQLAPSLGIR
jgi:hypothetical protein